MKSPARQVCITYPSLAGQALEQQHRGEPGGSHEAFAQSRCGGPTLIVSCQGRAQSPAAPDLPPAAQTVAAGVWLIPGGFPPKREPDGNTVVFAAPRGLVVLDTGRHAWHRQAILDLARDRRAPIVAIVNSHWHLDHTSGNAALKRAFPGARVFASRAALGALKDFLPKSAQDTRDYLASEKNVDPATAEDLRGDLDAIADPAALIPDVPIDRTRTLSIGGRRLEVHLARTRRRPATSGSTIRRPAPPPSATSSPCPPPSWTPPAPPAGARRWARSGRRRSDARSRGTDRC